MFNTGGKQHMRHDHFAERAAKTLEEMAASLEKEDMRRVGGSITAMRANELRVGAQTVRDLSEAVARAESRRASGAA